MGRIIAAAGLRGSSGRRCTNIVRRGRSISCADRDPLGLVTVESKHRHVLIKGSVRGRESPVRGPHENRRMGLAGPKYE